MHIREHGAMPYIVPEDPANLYSWRKRKMSAPIIEKKQTFIRKFNPETKECSMENTSEKPLFVSLKNGKIVLVRGIQKTGVFRLDPGMTLIINNRSGTRW